ncbi:hypothetical protein AHAS_Ahas04G0171300 [Arachis hypogaea]
MAVDNQFSQWLLAAVEKNKKKIPKMHVTYCNRRTSVFVVEELEPFEGWSQGSFRVWLSGRTCGCSLLQSLYFPCHHAFASCAIAGVE